MKKLLKHIIYIGLVTLPITFTGCSEENREIPAHKEEYKTETPVSTVDTEMNQTIDSYLDD